MSEKTKAPTGLKVTRNNKDYICEWKIGDANYGDGQQFQYLFNHSGKDSWVTNVEVGVSTTSKKITLKYDKCWPKKGKKKVIDFRFRVRGNQKAYKKKKKKHNPDWSNWSTKIFDIKEPLKPSVSAAKQNEEFTCIFTWSSVGSTGDARPYTDAHWETILVKNSPTAAKDVAGKFKPGTLGWEQSGSNNADNYSAALSGSKTINENTISLTSGSWTRWFRVKTRGPGGDSDWAYAKHTYAMPLEAQIDVKSISATKKSDGTIDVYLEWTADTASGKRPIAQTVVSYAVAIPTATLGCPGETSFTDTIPQKDTGGKDGKKFTIPSTVTIGKDKALFLKVTTQYDGKENESGAVRVTDIKLDMNAPTFAGSTPVVVDDSTYMVTVTANHVCQIPDSFIAVLYKTKKNPQERIIGVIGANESSTQIQLEDWSQEGAKNFGIKTVVGTWEQTSAYHRRLTETLAESSVTWNGGAVPEAPQNVGYNLPNGLDGTVQITWDWTWDEANAVELSWADHEDAWESTNGPSSYTVDSMKPSHWNISGLTTGIKWYIRVRLLRIDGESAIYGAYSDTLIVDLKSTPAKPSLVLTPDVITRTGTTIATWAYVSDDGTSQQAARICEATVAQDGTPTPGNVIVEVTGNSQRTTIDPTKIDGWGTTSGETHSLCVQVTSINGKTSDDWSDPVTLTIADPPTTSITDIGENLVLETTKLNESTHQGAEVIFSHQDCKPFITNVEMDVTHQNEGEGTPTPTNIRHISGYNSAIVTKSDENDEGVLTDTTYFPNDLAPIYEGHFNMTTGELVITGHVIELDGTENWVKYGDYMCMDLTGYDYVKNDNLQSDRYVYADATDNGFYIGDINNFVDYGIVQTMFAE